MAKEKDKETPLMQQYNAIKGKYPGALLLFRVGDFYETFGEDAVTAAQILGIVLTKRGNGAAGHVELAGFPHHSLDNYLGKLVRAGQRVAICDQLEDPKTTKSIVKRGVTELVTPGVATHDNIVEQKKNNYLVGIFESRQVMAAAFLDISTGEFFIGQGSSEYINRLLQSLKPSEVLFGRSFKKDYEQSYGTFYHTYAIDDWIFTFDYASETLLKHFGVANLKGFGIHKAEAGIIAAGAVLHYVKETEHRNLTHINSVSMLHPASHMWLDRFTIQNLELLRTNNEGGKALYDILDYCVTPMGSRLLQKWIVMPLVRQADIESRQSVVAGFSDNPQLHEDILKRLSQVGDLERLISKVGLYKAGPRELLQIRKALLLVADIKELATGGDGLNYLKVLSGKLNVCGEAIQYIGDHIDDNAPAVAAKGNVIAQRVNNELDELRDLAITSP